MNENQSITGNVIKNWLLAVKPIVENAKTDYTLVGIAQEAFEWIENLLSGYDVAQDVIDTAQAENAALRARVARLEAELAKFTALYTNDEAAYEKALEALKALEAGGEGGE